MVETRQLPPFPDELVTGRDKERAIRFLLELALPGRFAARDLQRWGELTEVSVTPADFARVRRRRRSPG